MFPFALAFVVFSYLTIMIGLVASGFVIAVALV
jgi:hypothetical protein